MSDQRSIVLITTGQPSTNPRLVKEAISLIENGYKVAVIYSFWVQWADKNDEIIKNENRQIQWYCVGGHPIHTPIYYWYTRLRYKVYKSMAAKCASAIYWQQRAAFRCFNEAKKMASSLKGDLFIAHNLGALPVAAIAAKKKNAQLGFDFEDYYVGQTIDDREYVAQVNLLEANYLEQTNYTTAASPLIAAIYKKQYPFLNTVTINNTFSVNYINKNPALYAKGATLKLFWFSQTVGKNRGLEELIEAIGLIKNLPVSLTILGSCSKEITNYFDDIAVTFYIEPETIKYIEPVGLQELFAIAGEHHIGMASEVEASLNRQICLTNKLFTYLLSGLALIVTQTKAQQFFLDENPLIGVSYEAGNIEKLASLIQAYFENPDLLNVHRAASWQLAHNKMNWEKEEKIFLNIINQTLDF